MKSKLSFKSKYLISGVEINTLGLPPSFGTLASISPKALETDSFPGINLKGPNTFSFLLNEASVLYKHLILYIHTDKFCLLLQ